MSRRGLRGPCRARPASARCVGRSYSAGVWELALAGLPQHELYVVTTPDFGFVQDGTCPRNPNPVSAD